MNQAVVNETKSIIADLANRYGMEKTHFEKVMMATVMPAKVEVSREQFVAFLSVAQEYDLNPMTKEIYAFPAKTGGIQPIVSIDGWMRIINGHKQFDGMIFKDIKDDKAKVVAIEAIIYRKDRQHPITVTEYMDECKRNTEPWNKWPIRMLRHKAVIQCARYAFGFSGIYDQDEVERFVDVTPPTPKQNIELNNHFMGSGSSEKIEHKPQLDTLLKQANRQQPEPVSGKNAQTESVGVSDKPATVSEKEMVEQPLPLGLPNEEVIARAETLIEDMAGKSPVEKQAMLQEMGGTGLMGQLDLVNPALKEKLINTMMGA